MVGRPAPAAPVVTTSIQQSNLRGSPAALPTTDTTSVYVDTGQVNNISDPENFSRQLLGFLGVPVNATTTSLVNAWQVVEGQWGAHGQFNSMATHNPLNIESNPRQPAYGGQGIWTGGFAQGRQICDSGGNCTLSFPTWADGVKATAAFIYQFQPKIRAALAAGSTSAFFGAVGGWNPGSPAYSGQIAKTFGRPDLSATATIKGSPISLDGGSTAASESTGASILGLLGPLGKAVPTPSNLKAALGDAFKMALGVGMIYLGVKLLQGGQMPRVLNVKQPKAPAPLSDQDKADLDEEMRFKRMQSEGDLGPRGGQTTQYRRRARRSMERRVAA